MINHIKVNGDTYLPVNSIKFARPIDGEEQQRISDRYGIDASRFNSQLTVTTRDKPLLVRETCEELSAAGLALVNLGNDKRVPAENIIAAKDLDKAGREKLTAKGLTISDQFRATVETSNGMVLSKAYPAQIMDRIAKAKSVLAAQSAPAANDEVAAAPEAVNE